MRQSGAAACCRETLGAAPSPGTAALNSQRQDFIMTMERIRAGEGDYMEVRAWGALISDLTYKPLPSINLDLPLDLNRISKGGEYQSNVSRDQEAANLLGI